LKVYPVWVMPIVYRGPFLQAQNGRSVKLIAAWRVVSRLRMLSVAQLLLIQFYSVVLKRNNKFTVLHLLLGTR
jgi:hypothetical protein